jgi:hypothetical protein
VPQVTLTCLLGFTLGASLAAGLVVHGPRAWVGVFACAFLAFWVRGMKIDARLRREWRDR